MVYNRPDIRPMAAKDKAAVIKILKATPEFKPAEVTVAEELIDCYLEDPSGLTYPTLVAEIDSKVVGYICTGPTPLTEGTWDIYWMAVARDKQGSGIGSALLNYAEEKIRKAKGRQAFIETSSKPDYERTRRFHFSHGYEMVCQIADFYAQGDDKLILRKRLSP